MAILHNRRLNGLLFALTLPSNGTPPGQVGSLAGSTVTANTITATYTAASGTAPLTYVGYTSRHGASAWAQNAGSFGGSGGTFSGLSAATSYDLRIVVSNSAGSSTTDLVTGVTTSASATIPSQVGSLTAVGPTAFTIPVTYVAPTGTSPITFVGYTSPHNAGSWTENSGAFTNTGGTFYGLSPTTSYDLRVVASNSAGSSTTDLLAGISTVAAPSFSGRANRFDIVPSASVAASGSGVTFTAYPNGTWSGQTLTPMVASGIGSFTPSSVTTASGSSASVNFIYTPSTTGEHAIAVTNNGSLYNPYNAPLNVFSAGAGIARHITATITSGLDPQPRQFDTLLGVASGFSFPGAKGWGAVSINLSAIDGATDGLWIRLYDADSSGATTTVGSGTALHSSPVQVYGSVSNVGTKSLLLPASSYLYFADIATDPAFTNPVRIPQRFSVWLGMGVECRSQEAGIGWWWYDNTAPTGETFNKVLIQYSGDCRYAPQVPIWYRESGSVSAPNANPGGVTAGAQAAARFVSSVMGVGLFIVGVPANGGGVDEFINHDGSFTPAFPVTISGAGIDGKFRWLWAASLDGWDNVNSTYTESYTEYQTRFVTAIDWVARSYPCCAVQGWGAGGTGRPEPNGSAMSGINGAGSATPGAARLQDIFLSQVEPVNPMAFSKDNHAWAGYYGGHGDQSSKRIYAQTGIRQMLSAELAIYGGLQTYNRGPTLMPTGTTASGSNIIRLPGKLNGGTALQTVTITQQRPNYTVAFGASTAANLASLVAVYPTGGYSGATGAAGTPFPIAGVVISTSNLPSGADFTLDVTLGAGVTVPSNGFSVHYAADLNASGGTGYQVIDTTGVPPPSIVNMICDNQVSAPWEWGRHIRPKLGIQISVV